MKTVTVKTPARHFIIGGAQRSATTYLTRILNEHPDIEQAKPIRPEPKFFLKPDEYAEGYKGYIARYFSHVVPSSHKVFGEKSTSYIECQAAAERIKALLPDVRLIFLLRHPIERAVSNIHFSRMHGYETAPLETALLREIDAPETVVSMDRAGISVSPQAYLARSYYADHLRPWFDIFSADQIIILVKEQLTGNAQQVKSVYEFLGVDPTFEPACLSETINASQKDDDMLSATTLARVKAFFDAKNKALEALCGIDVSIWNTQ